MFAHRVIQSSKISDTCQTKRLKFESNAALRDDGEMIRHGWNSGRLANQRNRGEAPRTCCSAAFPMFYPHTIELLKEAKSNTASRPPERQPRLNRVTLPKPCHTF